MYDPDPQRPALRLGEAKASKLVEVAEHPGFSTAEWLAVCERRMEEAIKLWVDAHNAWATERLQSLPIPASKSAPLTNEQKLDRWMERGGPSWTAPKAKPIGDGAMRYERPTIYRASGQVERF